MSKQGRATPATVARPSQGGSNDLSQSIVRVGVKAPLFADFYHDVLQMRWSVFLLSVFFAQIAANLAFAVLYWAGGNRISNAPTFLDTFYFSVQTWATIGYGGMTPTSTWTNMLVVVESAAATIFTAVATGLTFAKFARPAARVRFSNKMVMSTRDGKRVLMFRVANERGNYVVEASARVSLIREETTREGETMRRVLDLKLVRDIQPIFLFSWTVMHEVDEHSPLHGVDAAMMEAGTMRVSVALTAFDGTLSQTIHATQMYLPEQIVFDARFVDVMTPLPDGRTQLDFTAFDDVMKTG